MPSYALPPRPSLEQVRKRAKELRDLVRTGHAKFTAIAQRYHPDPPASWPEFTLADAQLVLARHYGFASWRRLRSHLDLIARHTRSPQRRPATADPLADEFLRLACLTYRPPWVALEGEDADGPHRHAAARALLASAPELGRASIHTAAATGDVEAVRGFLEADAAQAHREGGPHAWPPLLYLALSRLDIGDPLATARLLLDRGADPNAGYLPDGQPPPVTALSGCFWGRLDPANQPPHPRSLALARLLLDRGADVNDERAVENACGYPHDDAALSLLLRFGFGRSGPGREAIGREAIGREESGREESGREESGREESGREESGRQTIGREGPRSRAIGREGQRSQAISRDRAAGRWQVALGAALRSPLEVINEELRYAAEMNLPGRVRMLVGLAGRSGIDFALATATQNGNTEIESMLLAAGGVPGDTATIDRVVAAAMRGDETTARAILETSPGLDTSAAGSDPVAHAAILNRPEAVKLLVALGFPLNDRRGSPLHFAALLGHLEVAKLLVELGCDPHAEAHDDTPGQFTPPERTPLGWARYFGHRDVIAYLASL